MHPPRHPSAGASLEGLRLRVFQVMGHFVQERVEQLIHRPPPGLPVVRVDPDQSPSLVVPPRTRTVARVFTSTEKSISQT